MVYEYYETLKKETELAIWKKTRTHTEDKTINDDAIERLRTKHDAIESERNWKIQDLISRYALSIQIVQTLVSSVLKSCGTELSDIREGRFRRNS